MRIIKQLFEFYINSSIHVAFAVFSLTYITLIEFKVPYDKNLLYFVFFASITGYNFVKYFGLAKFHHRSLSQWLKVIQIFSLLSFLMMCYFAYQLDIKTVAYIVVLGAVTFLYAIPFLPKKVLFDKHQNLRSISGMKIYIIALVWSGVTVGLPLINNNYEFDFDVIITTIQRFLFVVVLMLPFEIRDLNFDSLKLATLPQQIGVKQTKIIGVILVTLLFFLEFFKDSTSYRMIVSSLIISLVSLLFLIFAKQNQRKYYSAFWVEGIPVLWLLLLLIF